MANPGTFRTPFKVIVQIAEGEPQEIASGHLDLPIVHNSKKSSDVAVTGVRPALAEVFGEISDEMRRRKS